MARVLLTGFCAVPGPRRAGVQLRHVIRSLTPLHTVDLLVSREGEQAYVERQGSVRVLRVPTHEADVRSQIQAFQRALKRQLDGADYDFVHCRDSWSGIPVLEARARMGFAVVYDLTRSPLGETTFDTDLDAQYGRDEEACLLAADLILAPTAAAVKSLQARGRPDRVILSPPGVDVDRFDWEDVTSAGPPRILYVGSIDPGRGVRVLVRAMSAIAREVDARLVLAGSMAPKFDQALRDGIRELGLADKIDVLGPIDHDQLPALLATATVCVVPAAADLTPNPTVVYPTKLLEYMACRCAIVAPRRDTVMQVVDNNREALLFEPGDPIDLARKVLRLLDEPALRRNLSHNAYERVRRDFTASAARRAIRNAYAVLTERYADQIHDSDDDAPKVEILADDDFEATVFEEAPHSPDNTAENKIGSLDDALASLDDHSTSSESIAAPPAPADETAERTPVRPGARDGRDTGAYTVSRTAKRVPGSEKDEWVVTNVGRALGEEDDGIEVESGEIHADDEGPDDHGTPIEGVVAVAPPLGSVGESTFVAGEIDVPTPPPEREAASPVEIDLEQLSAGSLLGSETPEPDTGSRTPPIERR
jgi:glycosyltransferase involved in cell wall biosynthesis